MRQVDASAELSITEGYTLDPRCIPAASPVNQPESSTNG
jgi:hypothetical protein